MRIMFGDLRIGDIARRYVQRALDENWVSEGANVREFEQKFADKFGYKHAIATSSGTDADIVSCASLYDFGAKRGDEIIVPALSFVATANSILAAGFIPKFVDIEIETLNIDPAKIEEAITKKTRGIMVVHTIGKPCEMDAILEIAKKHNLKIIEDSCEALGGRYKGRPAGSMGDAGAFGFYPNKQVTTGEGGMMVTNDDELADVCRSLRNQGRNTAGGWLDHRRLGYNYRISDIACALGAAQLDRLEDILATRARVAGWYVERLAKEPRIHLQQILPGLAVLIQLGEYELRISYQGSQDIVQIVGHPAGQNRDGLETLGLGQTFLEIRSAPRRDDLGTFVVELQLPELSLQVGQLLLFRSVPQGPERIAQGNGKQPDQ